MRQALKTLLALAIAFLLVFAVRALAFTVYTVPTDLSAELHRGDRVLVNRLSHARPQRGDLVAFGDTLPMLGKVIARAGDTLQLGQQRYLIPRRCCSRCRCNDCHLYLVDLGESRRLVYYHEIIGRATRLFHLPW